MLLVARSPWRFVPRAALLSSKSFTAVSRFALGASRAACVALFGAKGPRGDGGRKQPKPEPLLMKLSLPLKSLTEKILGLRGDSKELERRLEEAEHEAALNQQAAEEMQLALEEEVAFSKQAESMLGYQFVGAQSGYNELLSLFETSRTESSKQFEALRERLEASQKAQRLAEASVQQLRTALARLQREARALHREASRLRAALAAACSENAELRAQAQAQQAMIAELLELQQQGAERREVIYRENELLRRRLEAAERSLALLMD